MALGKRRRLWFEVGASLIAVDTLVHNSCIGPESFGDFQRIISTVKGAMGHSDAPAFCD